MIIGNEKAAYKIFYKAFNKYGYVLLQTCDEGYDYNLYNSDLYLIDGGIITNLDISMDNALRAVCDDYELKKDTAKAIDVAKFEQHLDEVA